MGMLLRSFMHTCTAEASTALNMLWAWQPGFLLPLELPEEDRNFDDKADIVELNGLSIAEQFTLSSQEDPSTELLAYLRLLNLRGVLSQEEVVRAPSDFLPGCGATRSPQWSDKIL